MKKLFCVALLTVVASANGCSSSSETKTPPGESSMDHPDSGSTSTAAPKAPTLDAVEKMMGALHVMWTNNDMSCDSIEGERQAAMSDGSIMEKYKVVFSESGEAEDKHDTTATDDMEYTYRLRCKKGKTYSEYSNSLSGNPVK